MDRSIRLLSRSSMCPPWFKPRSRLGHDSVRVLKADHAWVDSGERTDRLFRLPSEFAEEEPKPPPVLALSASNGFVLVLRRPRDLAR